MQSMYIMSWKLFLFLWSVFFLFFALHQASVLYFVVCLHANTTLPLIFRTSIMLRFFFFFFFINVESWQFLYRAAHLFFSLVCLTIYTLFFSSLELSVEVFVHVAYNIRRWAARKEKNNEKGKNNKSKTKDLFLIHLSHTSCTISLLLRPKSGELRQRYLRSNEIHKS